MSKIAVLGAGINGISTALAIQERIPNVEVTIIAEKFSPDTTSDVAAGFIEPYLCGDDVERITKWTKATISRIQEYMAQGNLGAEEMSGYWLQSVQEVPKWLEVMKNVQIYNEKELKEKGIQKKPEHRFGVFYTTWYLEPTAYIKWSTSLFLKNGGKFKKQKIQDISEVQNQNYDIIVNCTGLGSRKLFNDTKIYPVRGQIIRVSCPSVKHFLIDDDYYALLNDKCIILGGTKDQNNWDTSIDPLTATKIFEGNCRNIPSLKNAKILSHHCGLRPVRDTVRVEIEKTRDGRQVVHNYGHGGSGITLHWGCALESAELVEKVLREQKNMSKL